MRKRTRPRSTKRVGAPRAYGDGAEAQHLLRLSAGLLARIDARIAALNAERRGQWSRNAYLLHMIEAALDGTPAEQPRA